MAAERRPSSPPTGVLFVPVSGGAGSGELQRARMLARGLRQLDRSLPLSIAAGGEWREEGVRQWPLPHSPTHCTSEVLAAIRTLRPAVVLFDSTARHAQLKAARDSGALVVYLSSRASARRRGFRWRVLSCLDAHWSIEAALDHTLPSWWQKQLLRWHSRVAWQSFGVLHEPPAPQAWPAPLAEWIAAHPDFVLYCPGGGGARIAGERAADVYRRAAQAQAARGRASLLVDGEAAAWQSTGSCACSGPLPNAALMACVAAARLAVLNGGSLLLQALALGKACVGAALMPDQPARLAALDRRGAVLKVAPEAAALAAAAERIAAEPALATRLCSAAAGLDLSNGYNRMLAMLQRRAAPLEATIGIGPP